MTESDLIDALAGSLDLIANRLDVLLGPRGETVYVYRVLAELRDQAREAAALATEPRADVLEEVVRALQSVALDYQTGRGTGTLPAVSETTWERVQVALRRLGIPVED